MHVYLHRQMMSVCIYVYVQEKEVHRLRRYMHEWDMHALSSIRILSWKNTPPRVTDHFRTTAHTTYHPYPFFFTIVPLHVFPLRVEQVLHPKRYCHHRKVMLLPGILRGLLRNRRTSVTSVSRPKLFVFVNFWSTFEYLIIGLVKKIICIICFLFVTYLIVKCILSMRYLPVFLQQIFE
jgi:hypothetical protein